ncbi:hypothetical protein HAX54_005345, partial [Datura stramonium]|nr:hypothetical protein [Datura stramonium]
LNQFFHTPIPCPHAIKALQHKKLDPLKKFTGDTTTKYVILLIKSRRCLLEKKSFDKVLLEHAMEPHELVKIVGRPK